MEWINKLSGQKINQIKKEEHNEKKMMRSKAPW
jgi:hypothetical protein